MKNLHTVVSNSPSRLVKIYNDVNRETFTLKLDVKVNDSFKEYINIYITSDEEIKVGDWVLWLSQNKIIKCEDGSLRDRQDMVKKIILTIDQDLIEDSVQEVDEEFLEWFVNNSSCEKVKLEHIGYVDAYKIIIPKEEYIFPDIKCKCIMFEPNSFTGMCKNCGFPPKEEPKTMFESLQEYLKNTPKEKVLEDWNEFQHLDNEGITVKEFLENQKQTDEKGRPLTYWGGLEERKQETLEVMKKEQTIEQASEYYAHNYFDMHETNNYQALKQGFINGAKWQQDQNKNLYSEEDMYKLMYEYQEWLVLTLEPVIPFEEWFEQFKKK